MDHPQPAVAAIGGLTLLVLLLNPAPRSGEGPRPAAPEKPRAHAQATSAALRSPPVPSAAGAGGPTEAAASVDQDPLQPIRDYFRTQGPDIRDLRRLDLSSMSPKDLTKQSQLDFLIATVPDPVDSRFGHRFDEAVDAIQSAIEAKGYVPDRYYQPWQEEKTRDAPDDRGQASRAERFVDHTGKFFTDADPQSDPKWARSPACLLYRKVGNPDQLLVVFLVGEAPTWGIHKVAFVNSLRLAALLLERWDPTTGSKSDVRILGPYFSGSQSSLERAINHFLAESKESARFGTFYVCTGSATGVDRNDFHRNASRGQAHKVVFWATVLPDVAVVSELFNYIGHRTWRGERIAMLTESDTKFGASIQAAIKGIKGEAVPLNLTYLRFPLHISEVRSAYGNDTVQDSSAAPRLVTPIETIPVPVDDSSKARDLFPAMSPRLTTATENLLVARILSTISRESFRFVGIAATDTRDKIFLISLIRQFCPDVQIFFSDNDLLLAYPQYSRFLTGSIVASTYPLFAPNREWSPPHRSTEHQHRMLFAYEGDQGYYNATVALLDKDYADKLKPGAGNLDDPVAQEYGMPFVALVDEIWQGNNGAPDGPQPVRAGAWGSNLPVWISVIGQNGAWPVEVRSPSKRPEAPIERYELNSAFVPQLVSGPEHAKAGFRLVCPDLPLTWCVFFAGYTFFCLFVCYVTVTPPRTGLLKHVPTPPGGTWFVDLFHPRGGAAGWEHTAYVLAYLSVMALTYAVLAFPAFIQIAVTIAAGMEFEFDSAAIWFPPLVTIATLVCIALTAFHKRPPLRHSHRWDGMRIAALLVAELVLIFLVADVGYLVWYSPDGLWTWLCFSFERMVTLLSGVSPTIPVVLLGAAALFGIHYQLKRLDLLRSFHVGCPYPGDKHGPFGAIIAADDEIRAMLSSSGWRSARRPAFALVAIITLVVLREFWVRHVASVEGIAFDSCVWTALVVLPTLELGALFRSVQLWRWMANLLDGLALLPMAGAYDRLPDKVRNIFGRYLANEPPEPIRLSLADQQLRAVAEYYQSRQDALYRRTSDPSAGAVPGAGERPDWDPVLAACRASLELVRPCWPARTAGESFPTRAGAEAEAEVEGAPADVVWLSRVEDLIAITTVAYINTFMVHLRNAFVYLTVGPLLLVAAAMSYPFQPHRLLVSCLWALVAASALVSLAIAVKMESNEFLSRVSKTNPNGFTFDRGFLTLLLTHILPLLSLIAAQFPEVSELLNSLIAPLARVVR